MRAGVRTKHKAVREGESERERESGGYKFLMIVQNTHYLFVASQLLSGTRSGNSQNKARERRRAGKRRQRSYLGRKTLRAPENKFSALPLKIQCIKAEVFFFVVEKKWLKKTELKGHGMGSAL